MNKKIDDSVIDEIVAFINDKINLPLIPENIEALLIRALLLFLLSLSAKNAMLPKVEV